MGKRIRAREGDRIGYFSFGADGKLYVTGTVTKRSGAWLYVELEHPRSRNMVEKDHPEYLGEINLMKDTIQVISEYTILEG